MRAKCINISTNKVINENITELNDAFYKWFGKSKMVDKNGKPLICYHGTNDEFDIFRTDINKNDLGYYGKGIYFTFGDDKHSKNEARYYGKNVLECYLKIENPFDYSSLLEYKGKSINIMGLNSMVFLYNLALKFTEIGNKIYINKIVWNEDHTGVNNVITISIIPKLVEKYKKLLKYIEGETNQGDKYKSGYVKWETVEFDYTEKGGKKGSYIDYEELGKWQYNISDEELEIGLIMDAIEKYDGISAAYHPEGYMTRNPIITDIIKQKGYDGIVQSMSGDEAVVFNSNQIKSINNKGTFNSNSNNIYENKNDGVNDKFNKWFKESKVIDEQGKPLIVYHGTEHVFDEFDITKGKKWAKKVGFWFSDRKDFVNLYGDITMPVYLSIIKPKIITQEQFDDWREKYHNNEDFWQKQKDKWLSDGYDGLIVKGKQETFAKQEMPITDFYVVFKPNQIKSVDNKGTFNPMSNNIYESKKSLNNNFYKWFGNSKVVDEQGNPLVVYHGTENKFTEFIKSKQVFGHHGKGFYFADKNYAENYYGNNYIKCYLKIENPFYMYKDYTIDDIKHIFKNDYNIIEDLVNDELKYNDKIGGYLFYTVAGNDRLIKAGYDGIIQDYVHVVFEPNQIKSVDNKGTFNPMSNNIYESKKSLNDNFYKWFGKSKVVDEQGKPLIVYHGTVEDFDVFEGRNGIYFTSDYNAANFFTGFINNKTIPRSNIIPCYLFIKNPLIITDIIEFDYDIFDNIVNDARTKGFDGVIFKKVVEPDYKKIHDQIVVFKSNQIKSAIGNNGNYDINSNNINESKTKETFNIPEEIQQFYNITGDMSNVKNWTGKPYEKIHPYSHLSKEENIKQNSMIRYVMISLDSNNIIPITINDEHHVGYDVLHDYIYRKYKVKHENYISICSWGNHYVYYQNNTTDIETAKIQTEALKRYIKYGGDKNLTIHIVGVKDYELSAEEYVKCKGDIPKYLDSIKTGDKLSYLGKQLIDIFKNLSESVKKYEYSDIKRENQLKPVFSWFDKLNSFFVIHREDLCRDIYSKYFKKLETAIDSENYKECIKIVYNYNGIKNYIHRMIKDDIEGKAEDFFVNIKQALIEFNGLSEI